MSFGDGDKAPPENDYREKLGALGWLANMTRPDLAFTQGHFSRAASDVRAQHMQRMNHYLRYVYGTQGTCLSYRVLEPGEKFTLQAYVDSDWKGCKQTGRSTGGHCICLNGQIISWTSKLMQGRPKMSSTEAEYTQLSKCGMDIDYFLKLFRWMAKFDSRIELLEGPVSVFEDNAGAVAVAAGQGSASKLRHMIATDDVHEHRVRDQVADGTLVVEKIGTGDNTVDLFTKPAASRTQMVKLLGKLNVDIK